MKKLCTLLFILLWAGLGIATIRRPADVDTAAKPPERIVCLAPNLTEIIFALGLGEKIVGVTSDSRYPPQALNKKNVGTFWQPNPEAVIATRPDLVLTLSFHQQQTVAEQLSRIGYRCLTVEIETIEQFYNAVEQIGAAASRQAEADALVSSLKKKLAVLSEKISRSPKVSVLWVVQTEPLRVAGTDTFIDELIRLAGGRNAIGKTIYQYPPIGLEQVIASAPDVIIHPAMENSAISLQTEQAMQFWSRLKNLPAVKNNRVYVVEPDKISRISPRLYDGVEMIAAYLHPEVFSERSSEQ
ncbi:MAG: helical backbone metal receptor [Planctomycetota bacterium]